MKKIKLLIHAIMILFAVASYANLQSFIFEIHPNLLLSNAIGISLGLSLVSMSIMLSTMIIKDRQYQIVLVVTLLLGVLSAGIQTASYAKDISIFWAIPLGSAPPLIGECLLAIALGAYTKSKKSESINSSQDLVAQGIRDEIANSVSNIDKSQIQQEVNMASQVITKAVVQKTVNDVISEIGVGDLVNFYSEDKLTIIVEELTHVFDARADKLSREQEKLSDIVNRLSEKINEGTTDLTNKRQQILDYITSNPGIKNKDVAEFFQVTPSYISQLKNM